MKKIEFTHKFEINDNGIPWSESNRKGMLNVNAAQIFISGDKEGLLCLAEKLIELAHSDIDGYHKHLDDVEAEGLGVIPEGAEITLGKIG